MVRISRPTLLTTTRRAPSVHQHAVVGALDANCPNVAHAQAVARHLRFARLPDVSEQVGGQLVLRVAPARHPFNDHVGQLEIEAVGDNGGHLADGCVLDHRDRHVARTVAGTAQDLAHGLLVGTGQLREHPDGAVEIGAVLPQDGDVVRVAVLNEDPAVPVEDDTPRRAQRENPLVVVLGQLPVFRVLNDLQVPE
jgi:hypothetical protein